MSNRARPYVFRFDSLWSKRNTVFKPGDKYSIPTVKGIMMQNYLVIENEGTCDWRNFSLLGVSSARDEGGKIGQFGSGAKHGILIALRAGLKIKITTSGYILEPRVKEVFINNKVHGQVVLFIENTKETIETSMTLGFGELDWETDLQAMLREFVSNALDAVGASDVDAWERINVYADNQISGCADTTKVFIEMRHDVRKEYSKINQMFLHTTKRQNLFVLPKEELSPAKIYRKGVFVRPVDNDQPFAMFDYNLQHGKIDESRKMDGYNLLKQAGETLFHPDRPREEIIAECKLILRKGIVEGEKVWEHGINWFAIDDEIACDAMKQLWGNDVVVTNDLHTMTKLSGKNLRIIYFPAYMSSWYSAAKSYCRRANDLIDRRVSQLKGIRDVDDECTQFVTRVIDKLDELGFILKNAKPLPKLLQFTGVVENGEALCGFVVQSQQTIYLSHEHTLNLRTVLEEVGHYYTENSDCTREFQDWIFHLATELLKPRL